MNGDGADDLVVGAYAAGSAGTAWLVHGVADPTTLPANDGDSGLVPVNAADRTRYVSLARLTPAQGSRIDGQQAGDRFGRTVAGVGDVDGDGAADLAVGADFALRYGRVNAGEVTVALLPAAAPAYTPDPDPIDPDPTDPEPRTPTQPEPRTPTVPVTPVTPVGPTTPVTPTTPSARTPAQVRTLKLGSTTLRRPAGALTATRTGVVTLGRVQCTRPGAARCTVTTTVTVKVGAKRWTVTAKLRPLRNGATASVTVTLPKAARAALKRTAKGSLVARVVSRDEDGRRGSGTWRAALRGAR